MPQRGTLYLFRVKLDLCSMLWSREYCFDKASLWYVHVRIDSSPQFSRDYLVGEADVVRLNDVYPADVNAMAKVSIQCRLLPIQVLGRRSTSTAFKYRSLLRMLDLESGAVDTVKQQTRSFLCDMGVEAKLSLVPEIDSHNAGETRRAFRLAMPFHDLDHGVHHVMQELLDGCWDPSMTALFDRQVRAFSKYFGKRDNCERFCKIRIWDSGMPYSSKKILSKIMSITCPVFTEHRWEYRYKCLSWICEREQVLRILDPSNFVSERDGDDEQENAQYQAFSDDDVDALRLLYSTANCTATFWAMAYCMLLVAKWGHSVVGWLHGCWCHPTEDERKEVCRATGKPCIWNGRRLIELSCGAVGGFVRRLKALSIDRDKFATEKVSQLLLSDRSAGQKVVKGFHTAKRVLEARFLQLTSFLQEVPWNLVKLLRFLIVPPTDASMRAEAVRQSREDAATFLHDHSSGRLTNIGDVGDRFFQEQRLYSALQRWAQGIDVHMHIELFRELLSYATSLLVMQRLESRHHLVHATRLCPNKDKTKI